MYEGVLPDDVLVLLVLPLGVLPPPVHHTGVYIGRAKHILVLGEGSNENKHIFSEVNP